MVQEVKLNKYEYIYIFSLSIIVETYAKTSSNFTHPYKTTCQVGSLLSQLSGSWCATFPIVGPVKSVPLTSLHPQLLSVHHSRSNPSFPFASPRLETRQLYQTHYLFVASFVHNRNSYIIYIIFQELAEIFSSLSSSP